MLEKLDKIIDCVRRTGDKVTLFRDDGEYTVMTLDDYYKMLGSGQDVKDLSEEELLNKINREIALWRETQREFEKIRQNEYLTKPYYDSLNDFDSDGDDELEEQGRYDDRAWAEESRFELHEDDGDERSACNPPAS